MASRDKKKKKFDYFEAFAELSAHAVAEAEYLIEISDKLPIKGEPGDIPALDAAHAIEMAADEASFSIHEAAEADFITPIDRGDLLDITQALDNVVNYPGLKFRACERKVS